MVAGLAQRQQLLWQAEGHQGRRRGTAEGYLRHLPLLGIPQGAPIQRRHDTGMTHHADGWQGRGLAAAVAAACSPPVVAAVIAALRPSGHQQLAWPTAAHALLQLGCVSQALATEA